MYIKASGIISFSKQELLTLLNLFIMPLKRGCWLIQAEQLGVWSGMLIDPSGSNLATEEQLSSTRCLGLKNFNTELLPGLRSDNQQKSTNHEEVRECEKLKSNYWHTDSSVLTIAKKLIKNKIIKQPATTNGGKKFKNHAA